ncbi:hypothetical protein A2892_01020 [Candidatus Woesebacteria bacterium RIFCSPLOWO2_01_FULL_39_10b]|uniref:Glycosyltransferase RgtA/B/C/D-like domain-containing protein n=1 Tax=Candidatus Woesebacteria bacterium RIFCSPLOWO2_01_FULL_39_10b TaxID=1802517 RepID=A0A1F8B9J3_9BACT|nr:MAG: hypothetical protein A2892_01020 [Candidatus Woesebacteria bacterium RIFCSPLOWO2_01_FULL_39_10b]
MGKIFLLFIGWRGFLLVTLSFAIGILPLQMNFLGGGLSNYLKHPYLWAWINFDGEHYLSIARQGYQPLTFFYFPLYPFLIRFLANIFGQDFVNLAISGLVISNLSFLIGIIGLAKLIRLDYSEKIVKLAILILLFFPTSFYFGSYYTESIFFASVIWSFYFARKGRWFWAGFLGGLSSLTRIIGLAIFPALLVEFFIVSDPARRFLKLRLSKFLPAFYLLMIPLGLSFYMFYLKRETGDPLEFFHSVSIFGEQRVPGFVLLPQVFYRYVFKVLPNIDYSYFPVVFTTWMETITAVSFGGLGLLGILGGFVLRLHSGSMRRIRIPKIRLSYVTYLVIGYLIPTLSGSFSSMPRYVLVLFPAYIIMAMFLSRVPKIAANLIFFLLIISLFIVTSLFTRGYWVS